MHIYKSIRILMSILLSVSTLSYAGNSAPVEFFVSNNTHTIDVETAYERLAGRAQQALNDKLIQLLQNNHIEQGRLENSLGLYQMASDKTITSDNTEIFYASPLQHFSNKQVFFLARQLADTLKQESVAIFIPANQFSTGNIRVTFKSHLLQLKK